MLAGVGTSWYASLEQGRDINVSEAVVCAIGRSLQLTSAELGYLYRLVGMRQLAHSTDGPKRQDNTDLEQVVAGWQPNPAVAIDDFWNILECNQAARDVFGFSAAETNLLTGFFTNGVTRGRHVDPARTARIAVAQFRSDMAEHYDSAEFDGVATYLSNVSAEFADLWERHEVLDLQGETTEIDHPETGRLRFDTCAWQLAGSRQVRLILHLPKQESDTRIKLRRRCAA